MSNAPADSRLVSRLRRHLREMPCLLWAATVGLLGISVVWFVNGVLYAIHGFVSESRPELWHPSLVLMFFIGMLGFWIIPAIVYFRPPYARGMLLAFAALLFCKTIVPAFPPLITWEAAILFVLCMALPVYYLYFRKNVAAYFQSASTS